MIGGAVAVVLVARAAVSKRPLGPDAKRFALVSGSFCAVALAAAAYLDLPIDKYKRYDFVPLFAALLAPIAVNAALSAFERRARPAVVRSTISVVLVMLVGTLATVSVSTNRRWHRELPTTQPKDYAGIDHLSWYGYLDRVRRAAPRACRYVFAFEELAHGRWQLEIPAVLASELRDYVVVGPPARVAGWRAPLRMGNATDVAASLTGCEAISAAAAAQLSAP